MFFTSKMNVLVYTCKLNLGRRLTSTHILFQEHLAESWMPGAITGEREENNDAGQEADEHKPNSKSLQPILMIWKLRGSQKHHRLLH